MNYYNEIKQELINNEITKKVKKYLINKSDLNTYYNVGKLLVEAQGGEERAKYGDGLIKEYSIKLNRELGKGYGVSNLKNMRQFYLLSKSLTLSDQLTWSHYIELLKIKDIYIINYYITISVEQNLSVRELRRKIKNKEYERLDESTKEKLINNEEIKINDLVKNPILIKNSYNYTEISENILKKLILNDLENFLIELGDGFTFIKSEYKIKIDDRYNYIDLLLYNIEYNCYVVVELKVTELKKEHIGQIQVYMNYIDKNVRKINHDKTIGIIICRQDNSYVIKYCSDNRIISRIYELIETK